MREADAFPDPMALAPLMTYVRNNIDDLQAYVPGEQPRDEAVIKLNTNENPFPPAPAVLEAIRSVTAEQLRRYPSPSASAFRTVAAATHGVDDDMVIATNGGDELLRLALTTFCDPRPEGAGVAVAEPSYSLAPVLAAIHDTRLLRIPLDSAFALPGDFARQVVTTGCRLAMVVNPHAPSGRLESLETLRAVASGLEGNAVLLVDEAYVDFADADASELVADDGRANVLLLRSLSKGYGLAGLRFGYGLAHRDLIAAMDKVRDSYNTDAVAQVAATAALGSRHIAAGNWSRVTTQRTRLTASLRQRGWEVLDSQANFVLAAPPTDHGQPSARALYCDLQKHRIFVRHFDAPTLSHRLRITIGTETHVDALIAAIDTASA